MNSAPILFLDIDGVLNGHQTICKDSQSTTLHGPQVKQLNRVLRETGANIILSSSWRYQIIAGKMTLAGMDLLLRSHGVMAGRLVGHTRPDTMVVDSNSGALVFVENERGPQISDWLSDNDWWDGYAVVDDLDLGISEIGHPFVKTDGTVGLTVEDADRLIDLLS